MCMYAYYRQNPKSFKAKIIAKFENEQTLPSFQSECPESGGEGCVTSTDT